MSKYFDETMQGLVEAVLIEKGSISLKEKSDMPAPTFYAENRERELIYELVCIRKEMRMSQGTLAHLTGNKQQAISRMEKVENSPSLKNFLNIVYALGYDLKLVRR